MTTNDKQGAANAGMTRKERRAAERKARKTGARTSGSGSGSGNGSGRSMLLISVGAVAIGLVAVIALVLVSGGFGNDAAAVSEPDAPAPAEELRQGRTLVAPDAVDPVVVEVFEDPQCPHCQTFTERVEPLIIAEHVSNGTASLAYRDFEIFGQPSIDAMVAMRAADQLGDAFWDYHHVLYHNAPDGPFSREWLTDIAEIVGLDREAFADLLDDEDLVAEVVAEEQAGVALGVSGTPAIVIDGELLGSASWEEIDAAIESAAADS